MAALSKEEAAAEKAKQGVNTVLISIFFSVLQHCIQSQSEPLLIRRLVNEDPVATAKILANTSGAIGVLGLFVNQIGGKLSDHIGRLPGFFVGPVSSALFGLLVHTYSDSLSVVVVCRVLRILLTGFSSSVMVGAAMSDMVSGKELSTAYSTLGAAVGLSIVVAPISEGLILKASNMDVTKPFLGLSVIGILHALFLHFRMYETNPKAESSLTFSKISSCLDLKSLNPLGFLNLFGKDEGLELAKEKSPDSPAVKAALVNRSIVSKLVVIGTFQSFLEGKCITDIASVWQREHLKWDAYQMQTYGVVYGVLCILAGKYMTPALINNFSPSFFTTFTNFTNFIGYYLRGAAEQDIYLWSAVPIMLFGVNGAAGHAVKSMATDRAAASGVGRGELSAWMNNLRAVTFATSPVIYGQFYAFAVNNGIYPGHVFLLASCLGALLPEVLHQMLGKDETQPIKEEEKKLVEEGAQMAAEAREGAGAAKSKSS